MSAALPSLHPRIWECIFLVFPTRFSGRELSLFTEIIPYFSSSVSSLRVRRETTALYMHSSTQTCFCIPVQCQCFAENALVNYEGERLIFSHNKLGCSQLDFCTILHHLQTKSVQLHVIQDVIKTRHRSVESRSGNQCLLQWLVLQGLVPILWQLIVHLTLYKICPISHWEAWYSHFVQHLHWPKCHTSLLRVIGVFNLLGAGLK